MADNQRNNVFATFLKKQLIHQPQNVLDVACGDGRLTVALLKLFPFANVVGIDPKPRGNKRRIRFLRGEFPKRVKTKRYDLIVGMHPDEATWAIVQESCKYCIIFAMVPCCLLHVPPSFPGGNMHQWVQYIASYAETHDMKVISTSLKMRGANQVVMGIPCESKIGNQ